MDLAYSDQCYAVFLATLALRYHLADDLQGIGQYEMDLPIVSDSNANRIYCLFCTYPICAVLWLSLTLGKSHFGIIGRYNVFH